MARKFLYIIATIIVLVIVGLFVLRIWAQELMALALVPSAEFEEQTPLTANAYADPAMWYSHPSLAAAEDPARWQPEFAGDRTIPVSAAGEASPEFVVFFVHPTSYVDRSSWNAPLGHQEAERVARVYLRGMASPFNEASEIWSPRYRQAAIGAFLTDQPAGLQAIDAAYSDIERAFAVFLKQTDPERPIVLAGHSQGALHLMRLLRNEVSGKPLAGRIAAAYIIGWPVSLTHDLPLLGLPACKAADQSGCVMSWSTFAEPADPSAVLDYYAKSTGLDGSIRGTSAILCTNPLTGGEEQSAPAAMNVGTLKPEGDLSNGELLPEAVPARCDSRGLLLIGDPPEMGRYVLPGNNYHIYDVPLFWANVQADVGQRVSAWTALR